ncbi:zinc-binding dehydrogenase [Seohaeicola zhoushanensis]
MGESYDLERGKGLGVRPADRTGELLAGLSWRVGHDRLCRRQRDPQGAGGRDNRDFRRNGAVGHVAGQIAKAIGCRVIGVAGGAEKCAAAVTEFGYDICVDHRDPAFAERLAEACPDGIDLDFENVGGPVRDAVWRLMNPFGRIAICGLISEYNAEGAVSGPSWQLALARRLTVRGFLLRDHLELRPDFIAEVSDLLAKGAFRTRETITDGIEKAPSAFIDMLQGRNFGKALVRV